MAGCPIPLDIIGPGCPPVAGRGYYSTDTHYVGGRPMEELRERAPSSVRVLIRVPGEIWLRPPAMLRWMGTS